MRVVPSRLTQAGSRWSKNSDFPVSISAMRAISSPVSIEVEDVDVLGHAVRPDGLRDDDDVALDEPA